LGLWPGKGWVVIMNWEAFTEASLVIQIHWAGAMLALGLGILMLVRKKGTASHKMIGRAFIGVMLLVAISSFFIREINRGGLSWIHIFIPITFFASWEAIHYIRKGNVKRHKQAVIGLFFGALLIPGLFTFLPGRRMWMLFFG